MKYKRRVSDNEYIYLAAGRAFSDLIIKSHIVGHGTLSQNRLQEAVDLVSTSFPGACLRKVGSYWESTSSPPRVKYLDVFPTSQSNFYALINSSHGLNPLSGPTCDILMHRNGKKINLIFRSLHAVMDGAGLDLWVRAIFKSLRGKFYVPCLSQVNEDELLAKNEKNVRNYKFYKPAFIGLGKSKHTSPDPEFVSTTLYGHSPTIIAQLCQGIAKILGTSNDIQCLFMIPCDLRKNTDPIYANSTANLSLPMFVSANLQTTVEDFVSSMLEQMEKRNYFSKGSLDTFIKQVPQYLLAKGLKTLWRFMSKSNQYLVSATLSHIGRKNLDDYSCFDFKAEKYLSVPCTIPICQISLVVNENDRYTELCLVIDKKIDIPVKKLLFDIIKKSGLQYLIPEKPKECTPKNQTLHQMFERQVTLSANNICLSFGKDSLSYNELNIHANQLAHALISLGIEKGDRIGLGLERCFELYTCIIAILKVGACFVPLDMNLFMLKAKIWKISWRPHIDSK